MNSLLAQKVLLFVVILNSMMLMSIALLGLTPLASMLLFTVIAVVVWRVYFKESITLGLEFKNYDIFFKISPLLFLLLLAASYYNLKHIDIDMKYTAYAVTMALVTATYEELLFRKILIDGLVQAKVKVSHAIYGSALLFALFHLYSAYDYALIDIILKMLNTFIMGTILGYIYFETRNILLAMSIHFLWDFESYMAGKSLNSEVDAAITLILFATSVLYFSWSYKRIKGL